MPTNQAEFYGGLERASDAISACSADRIAQAAAVHDAIQPLLDNTDDATELACRRGCSHCCHFPVGVTFAEALRLADTINKQPELRDRVLAANAATATHSWEQLVAVPCPLLVDDACTAHEARPMPCRALGSRDAEACEAALTTDEAPPRDEVAWWRGLGAASALAKPHPANPQTGGTRELRAAVSAILADANQPDVAFANARQAPGT